MSDTFLNNWYWTKLLLFLIPLASFKTKTVGKKQTLRNMNSEIKGEFKKKVFLPNRMFLKVFKVFRQRIASSWWTIISGGRTVGRTKLTEEDAYGHIFYNVYIFRREQCFWSQARLVQHLQRGCQVIHVEQVLRRTKKTLSVLTTDCPINSLGYNSWSCKDYGTH